MCRGGGGVGWGCPLPRPCCWPRPSIREHVTWQVPKRGCQLRDAGLAEPGAQPDLYLRARGQPRWDPSPTDVGGLSGPRWETRGSAPAPLGSWTPGLGSNQAGSEGQRGRLPTVSAAPGWGWLSWGGGWCPCRHVPRSSAPPSSPGPHGGCTARACKPSVSSSGGLPVPDPPPPPPLPAPGGRGRGPLVLAPPLAWRAGGDRTLSRATMEICPKPTLATSLRTLPCPAEKEERGPGTLAAQPSFAPGASGAGRESLLLACTG